MKRLTSMLLALALCLGLAAPALAAGPSFTDVSGDHWAYTYVERAAADKVVNGTGGGAFSPNGQVKGTEFIAMMTRAFYAEELAALPATSPWYARNVDVANGHGLLAGMTAADLDAPMTRYQMASVMYRILADREIALPGNEALAAAAEKISDWSGVPEDMQTAVASVFSLGLITGVGGGKFDGDAAMSRAQAAVVYCRLADALAAPEQDPAEPGPQEPAGPVEQEPGKPAEQEPAKPAEQEPEQVPDGPTLANGKAITDDNIREIIYGLQDEYPEGRPWTNDNYYLCEVMRIRGFGCEGFALICSDAVFGQLPLTETHSDFSRVRVGDLLRINHDTHTVVVLEVREDSVIVTEGNYNSSIHWGREITRQSLEDGAFTVRTRYPK